jgi:hypothetical protein
MEQKKVLIIGVPALAVALLVGALAFRSRGPSDAAPPKRREAPASGAERPATTSYVPAAPKPPPKPAPDSEIARATDEARVRSTYQNFRTAIATGNQPLQDALRPLILRDRAFAIDLARKDVSDAPSDLDRDIATKTLEALRR